MRFKKASTFEDALGGLLSQLCQDHGICLQGEKATAITSRDSFVAQAFAEAVLRAEGFTPEYEEKWCRTIERAFVDWFGKSSASVVDFA